MKEIEIADYARQLFEEHGAKAIALVAQLLARLAHQRIGAGVKDVQRHSQVPRVVEQAGGERIVAVAKIRLVSLARIVDACAARLFVRLAVVGEEQNLGSPRNLDGKAGAQQVGKVVVVLIEPGPEITKVDLKRARHQLRSAFSTTASCIMNKRGRSCSHDRASTPP